MEYATLRTRRVLLFLGDVAGSECHGAVPICKHTCVIKEDRNQLLQIQFRSEDVLHLQEEFCVRTMKLGNKCEFTYQVE